MSVATLRFSPWQAKRQLPSAKYASLTVAVSKVLFHTISQPENKLDVPWAQAFVRSYAQDSARHALEADNEDSLSSHELSIRTLAFQLAGRLARVQGGLDVSALVDLAVAYGTGNATSLRTLFEDACKSTPALLEESKKEVVPAFKATLQNPESRSIRNGARVLSLFLHCASPRVVSLFLEDQEFILELARCYQVGLEKLAASRGGIQVNPSNETPAWQKDWLYAKTGLLDVFHAIVQALLQNTLPKDEEHLFDVLFAILELPSSSSPSPTTPFVSRSLLADYQYAFDLSDALTERFRGADDARVDLLAATLANLAPPSHGPKPAGGLSVLLKDKDGPHIRVVAPAPDVKGKGKAVDQDPERETQLDLAVSQVLDILPTHTPQYIRRCLKHPAFDANPEKLISALLEETLPLDLVEDVDGVPEQIPEKEEYQFIKDRRNAWDEDTMDFSRLRIGKTREDADALLQDRSFVEQMKADIIRRAEELSDEEDETAGQPRPRTVAFEEELDDDTESLGDKDVKVVGDGEGSDEEKDEGDATEAPGPPVETILELAYISDPKVFDRDGATRRSKTRADLKAKTGWGDEQIEGWRIMLERNPRKDKILQKHEFAGNAPLVPNTNANEPGPSGSSRGGSSHRGRGGDGRGRGRGGGRGGGEGGDTARGRAWKDKNKARTGNHNRKRGHDKKMARGGGGAPV